MKGAGKKVPVIFLKILLSPARYHWGTGSGMLLTKRAEVDVLIAFDLFGSPYLFGSPQLALELAFKSSARERRVPSAILLKLQNNPIGQSAEQQLTLPKVALAKRSIALVN